MSNEGAKKKGKVPGDKKTSKRKAKRRETYAVYIYKVLKQVRKFSYIIKMIKEQLQNFDSGCEFQVDEMRLTPRVVRLRSIRESLF